MLAVNTREGREKIPWQYRKNTGWHFSTVGKEVLFVKGEKRERRGKRQRNTRSLSDLGQNAIKDSTKRENMINLKA